MALGKISFHYKTVVRLLRLDLEYGSIVIAEMIVCPLPKVCVRGRRDAERIAVDGISRRFAGPLESGQVDFPPFSIAVATPSTKLDGEDVVVWLPQENRKRQRQVNAKALDRFFMLYRLFGPASNADQSV